MTEHIPAFIVATLVLFFMAGVGYLIVLDTRYAVQFRQQCIESGMQYVNGSCIK
jgi:hypothetical protein